VFYLSAPGYSVEAAAIQELLTQLCTSHRTLAVSDTKQAKKDAVASLKGGFEFAGATGVTMEEIDVEPDRVQWPNTATRAGRRRP